MALVNGRIEKEKQMKEFMKAKESESNRNGFWFSYVLLVIPEIKAKKDRLKEPSKEELDEAIKKKDEVIERERKKINALYEK